VSTRRKSMASRAAMTPTAPERPLPAGFYDDGAVLALAKLKPKAKAAMERSASLWVCCWAIRRGDSAEQAAEDLRALGLVADPESFERWHWGKAPRDGGG
jgi:hypothetical protein